MILADGATHSHLPRLTRPESLFGYDVVDSLGEGAGSMIYAVADPISGQVYAMKHVIRRTDRDARFVEQLENEFEVGQHVTDPRLRRAIELKANRTFLRKITEAGLVLELFDGMPLDMHQPKGVPETVDCFLQTAMGLESLHELGYVHCDLKPNNILVGSAGQVKIIDLGQACKAGTAKQRIQGTPDYIAPEQVKCEPVTPRTDVFNFGATLYWVLCGRKLPTLFTLRRTENSFLVDEAMASPSAINPLIPENLSNLVMECVRTNPIRRPNGMGELIHRLEIIQHGLTRAAQIQSTRRAVV